MTPETSEPTIVVPPARPRRWVTLVLCTVIFAAGGIVGWGLTVRLQQKDWPPPNKTFEQRRDQFTERIGGKLDLTPEQTDTLRDIVSRRIRAFESIRQKMLPEMHAQHEALDRELRPLLNEEQAKRWDELYAALNERWFTPAPSEGAETQPTTQPK
jgi:hypothetical protein